MSNRLLARRIDLGGAQRRRHLRAGVLAVLTALGRPAAPDATSAALLSALEASLDGAGSGPVWLAQSVLSGRLPLPADVLRLTRSAQLDGPLRALTPALLTGGRRPVDVLQDVVLVDLHHTVATDLDTGIQRVVRRAAASWHRDHAPRLVRWDATMRSLCELSAGERHAALTPGTPAVYPASPARLVVPWRCTYVLPELALERPRTRRLHALLEHSSSRGAVIGYDCVPVTSAETAASGVGAGFTGLLAAMAHARVVATISEASAGDFRGWRSMLEGTGLPRPDVVAVPLPTEGPRLEPGALERARALLPEDAPAVLCVGSHEPRKNHLAVLHAAQDLWAQGLSFTLVMVGGNAWRADASASLAARLAEAGRPLVLLREVDDQLLAGLYASARLTVFPSFTEGFGLPIAESLAVGTPVITSGYGAMRELAEGGGGALLVDPRDDEDVTSALRRLLVDDALHAELSAQARARPVRTWDEYAAQAWQVLVGDR